MKTNFYSIPVVWILVTTLTQTSLAASNGKTIVAQGNKVGATACIACHGQKGMGNKQAGYPYLAGLPANYIKRQLTNFKNGNRQNAIMMPIANKLSNQDIESVADYYSSLKNNILANTDPRGKSQDMQGQRLFEKGKWSEGMPACIQCHGPNGAGVASPFPPIIGQPSDYTRNQIAAWQNGKRKGDPVGLMHSVASKLTDGEVNSLAHFLAMQ